MSSRGAGTPRGESADDAVARIEAMQRELARLRGDLAAMANLYVSSCQLQGARERDEVLTVMQEIVISLVGSEEFGIFERVGAGARLQPTAVFGLGPDAVEWVSRADGIVGACIADGVLRVRRGDRDLADGEHGARLTALVPLRRGDLAIGVVAVFSMLPHKGELTGADLDLLELLATHASKSLHYADLHARAWGARRSAPPAAPARGEH